MNTEHATPELFSALSKAQGEIENATKNAKNPHFRSDYADLAEILNTVRPIFAKHGLVLSQSPSFDGSIASVTTVIAHETGGCIIGLASCVPAKSDAQGIGSATTYLRRYSAAAMAGIAQEDDDGNGAAHDRKPAPASTRNKPRQETAKQAAPNPYLEDIETLRKQMTADAINADVAPDQENADKWFKTLAAAAAKEIGKRTSDMSTTEYAKWRERMLVLALESENAADAAKQGVG